MENNSNKIIILGAGISGLSTAFWLMQKGLDVMVLEADEIPGGSVKTKFEDGFLIEQGPNSGLETTPAIKKLVEEVGLQDQMIYANDEAKKRYVLKNNQLMALPTDPGLFLKTSLFSLPAKLRLFMEPFIGKSKDGYYQSVADFVKRRLGKEFLDYAIDPFVSGIFAGDPAQLSVNSAFPKLYRLEEVYGGLIKGMIKGAKERKKQAEVSKQLAKMFSFKNGMGMLIDSLAEKLDGKICYDASVESVKKNDDGFVVEYSHEGLKKKLSTYKLISTIPAYRAKNIFKHLDQQLEKHFETIYYPPVMTLYLGYRKEETPPLDGFGFLIPSLEKKNFLGAIWNSTIFPQRAPDGYVSFTLFIGGAKNSNIFEKGEEKVIDEAIVEFQKIMEIQNPPVIKQAKLWHNAIPQYNIGYIEHEQYFIKAEEQFKGLYLAGNYRGGISFGDCIKNSSELVERVLRED